MIDELIEETLAQMAPAVDTNGVVDTVRHRTQQRRARRRRQQISIVGAGLVALCALGVAIVRGDDPHRVATVDRAGSTRAVVADSTYFVPDWLPEDFVLRGQSVSMPCGPQVATCPWALNTTIYGQPGAPARAVTIAVLRAGAPVTTNAPVKVTVRGKPGALDHFERTEGPVSQWILSWAEDDATLVAFNGVDMTDFELLRIAEGLRPTTEAEWQPSNVPLESAPSIPDLATGIEKARLTTQGGEVVRLIEGVGRSWHCVVRATTSACAGFGTEPAVPIDERPDRPTIAATSAATGFAAYTISLPRQFPERFGVHDRNGRTMAFAVSDDRRFMLVVDTDTAGANTASLLAKFDFVAPDGTVIATT